MPADTGRHFEPGPAQLIGDQTGGLALLAGEFGVAVDLPAELDQFLVGVHQEADTQ